MFFFKYVFQIFSFMSFHCCRLGLPIFLSLRKGTNHLTLWKYILWVRKMCNYRKIEFLNRFRTVSFIVWEWTLFCWQTTTNFYPKIRQHHFSCRLWNLFIFFPKLNDCNPCTPIHNCASIPIYRHPHYSKRVCK